MCHGAGCWVSARAVVGELQLAQKRVGRMGNWMGPFGAEISTTGSIRKNRRECGTHGGNIVLLSMIQASWTGRELLQCWGNKRKGYGTMQKVYVVI